MMNTSELLTSIKMDLGIYGLTLPLDDPENQMHEVLKLKTLRTYSQFFPQILTHHYNIDNLEVIKRSFNVTTVRLPNVFGDRHIIGVRDVAPGSHMSGAGYMYPEMGGGGGSNDFLQSVMLGHANAHLHSALAPPFTFNFENPNLLHLYNWDAYSKDITVTLLISHFDNISSIPPSQWDAFEQLAILDIKAFLYGMLKHHTDFTTPLGTITLKIDDWASAQQERRELLNRWTEVYHLDDIGITFI